MKKGIGTVLKSTDLCPFEFTTKYKPNISRFILLFYDKINVTYSMSAILNSC